MRASFSRCNDSRVTAVTTVWKTESEDTDSVFIERKTENR